MNIRTKTFLFGGLVFTSLCMACKKDPQPGPEPTPEPVYPNYMPKTVGNYWVYQQFSIDTDGIATPTGQFDSSYIESDSVINGNTYHKLVKCTNGQCAPTYFRDSLHYLVSKEGNILFSSGKFNTLLQTQYLPISGIPVRLEISMTDKNVPVTVPGGTFITSNATFTYYLPPDPSWGNDTIRIRHCRYAKNVGLVQETVPFLLLWGGAQERRLVRYHVQ